MVNKNSTTFIVSEKVGIIIGKGVRNILIISGVSYVLKKVIKKSLGGK